MPWSRSCAAFRVALALSVTTILSSACANKLQASATQSIGVCGISFPESSSLEIRATPIDLSSIRDRISQERFNACPYEVELKMADNSIMMDFSGNASLRAYTDARRTSTPLYLGAWQYDGKNWSLDDSVLVVSSGRQQVFIKIIKGGILLSGLASRRALADPPDHPQDECFLLTLLGSNGWAGGISCAPSGETLAPLVQLKEVPFELTSTDNHRDAEQ